LLGSFFFRRLCFFRRLFLWWLFCLGGFLLWSFCDGFRLLLTLRLDCRSCDGLGLFCSLRWSFWLRWLCLGWLRLSRWLLLWSGSDLLGWL